MTDCWKSLPCFFLFLLGAVACGNETDSADADSATLPGASLLEPADGAPLGDQAPAPGTTPSGTPVDMGTPQDSTTNPTPHGQTTPGTTTPATPATPNGTNTAGTPAGPDGNDSFQEAMALETGEVMGVIGSPGDRDYYSFAGTAGQWMVIDISANPDDDRTKIDAVIRLYNQQMQLIAENDDGIPRVSTDSELITRLPADGTYFVEVLEFSDWMPNASNPTEGDTTYTYTLTVGNLNPESGIVTIGTESGDDAASAQAANVSDGFGLIAGTFETVTDVDVFRLTVGGTSAQRILAMVMPEGSTAGFGSTSAVGEIWITTADGATVLARLGASEEPQTLHPSVTAGEYLMWVAHPGGTLGTNDFYAIKTFIEDDGTAELAEATNGTIEGAENIVLEQRNESRNGFIRANLAPTDVDFFTVTTLANEDLLISCSGQNIGSGVRGVNLQLQDATGNVLIQGTETAAESANVRLEGQAAGAYYVRLTIGSQADDLAANFVRCGFFTFPAQ